ncbi:uncharacterized protein LACBIDRAFT_313279 [Laccaria bicolor S238N-H82]|uniref:Predicted protein n=1 Tax=Laccaria bicolor (strain S238N-H82 / ATCC MYA-4686) TaxID=486041 RepID=B0DXZ0_LACBS|nr:uncharacterized protein LACBIDRAFT_313279 [Laccaria bicolor S238N-H82]EDR00548.1 predicted protein [Laccaria bicolor S238N-H82]|eukprot:XP_001888775.1 predicted protein [Laccaria bicolor S238N-H82]
MLDLDSISLLLEWCANNSVSIDPRLRIDFDEHGGLGVFSTEDVIPQDATLVRITKDSVLSTRSCSLADHIPPVPYGLGAQIALSMALYGSSSRWYGYLQALPAEVDIPLFWNQQMASTRSPEDGLQALTWLTGTEVDKVLQQKAENEMTILVGLSTPTEI